LILHRVNEAENNNKKPNYGTLSSKKIKMYMIRTICDNAKLVDNSKSIYKST